MLLHFLPVEFPKKRRRQSRLEDHSLRMGMRGMWKRVSEKCSIFVDADGNGILEPEADDVTLTSEQEKMVTEVKKFIHECKRENPKVEDEKWKLEVVASTDAWRKVLDGLKEEDGQLERKKIEATMNLQTKVRVGTSTTT